jgi:hypothetical protein
MGRKMSGTREYVVENFVYQENKQGMILETQRRAALTPRQG